MYGAKFRLAGISLIKTVTSIFLVWKNMDTLSLEICSICNETMIEPKILPCAHSFCLKCLESLTSSKESLKCPKCQFDFQMPQGGLGDLKKNEFLERLARFKINVINCDSCDENEAVSYCVECSFNYCSNCLKPHGRIPSSANHELLSVRARGVKTDAKPKLPICKKHYEDSTIFCEYCNTLACCQCLASEHKNHKIKRGKDHLDILRNKFDEIIDSAEVVKERIQTDSKIANKFLSYYTLMASDWKDQIHKNGEDIKKAIDAYVSQWTDAIDKESRRINDEVVNIINGLERTCSEVQVEIEALKKDKRDQNYLNIEKPYSTSYPGLLISQFFTKFKVSFCPDKNLENDISLGKLTDCLHNDCDCSVNIDDDDMLEGDFLSFSTSNDTVFLSCPDEPLIECYSQDDFQLITDYDCGRMTEINTVRDLLTIEDKLFVFGDHIENKNFYLLLRMDLKAEYLGFEEIFTCQDLKAKCCIMSKSFNNNVLLAVVDKLLHLSDDGNLIKKVSLPFSVDCALQLDNQHYCCYNKFEGFSLIDEQGDILKKCLSIDLPKTTYARSLTRDRFGHICFCDMNGKFVVLDAFLNFTATFKFKSVRKIHYDKFSDRILLLDANGLTEVTLTSDDSSEANTDSERVL